MAGIYLHIPFCRSACNYCNFYFTTNKDENLYVKAIEAMCHELAVRKDFLGGEMVETIYFGGGTPSFIPREQIEQLISKINDEYEVSPEVEVTLEANPDDISPKSLKEWKTSGVNRLSIGIQSFVDRELWYMNRSHDAAGAKNALSAAKSEFENISVDLIYGVPDQSSSDLEHSLNTLKEYMPPHLSAYILTPETGTPFTRDLKKGKVQIDEDIIWEQYDLLKGMTSEMGLEHYEISNFAKEGFVSKHNSSYWKGKPYLGVGPSAHSFKRSRREWNPKQMNPYLRIIDGASVVVGEDLSEIEQMNELIMTGLRTHWGLELSLFPEEKIISLQQAAKPFIESGQLEEKDGKLYLTQDARLYADHITANLFFEES